MKNLFLTLTAALGLTISAQADDLKITINPHSPDEVAMANSYGFSSVEDWYVWMNRNVFLKLDVQEEQKIWQSLTPEQQRSLYKAEKKWTDWYTSLPSKTNQDILRRMSALKEHTSQLKAWLPKPEPVTAPDPPTNLNEGM